MSFKIQATKPASPAVPTLVAKAGMAAVVRFLECFSVNIRNPNTRASYGRAGAGVKHGRGWWS
jgi:hypothetical protein